VVFHPSWSDADRLEYGIHNVSIEPPAGKVWNGQITNDNGTPHPVYDDIVITSTQIIAERQRRLAQGFDFDFADARGIHRIGTTATDMDGWAEVTQWSNAAINTGAASATMAIVTDTGATTVTAQEWQQILVAAAQFRHPIWMASFALQALQPIPADYANDSYWVAP
jgi:hypothetical protein